jgi:Fe-S-cluster containining protein
MNALESMIELPKMQADIDDTSTWAKYRKALCQHCHGSCCTMAVEVKADDLVRMRLIDAFDLQDKLKLVARKLIKERLVEHFHSKSETFTRARMANGDCIYLDSHSRRCTIYDLRPDTCRNHPHIGPRPGYCAFRKK